MMSSDSKSMASASWWNCLWGTLVLASLVIGIAALWLPLDRHILVQTTILQLRNETTHLRYLLDQMSVDKGTLDQLKEDNSFFRTSLQQMSIDKGKLDQLKEDNSFFRTSLQQLKQKMIENEAATSDLSDRLAALVSLMDKDRGEHDNSNEIKAIANLEQQSRMLGQQIEALQREKQASQDRMQIEEIVHSLESNVRQVETVNRQIKNLEEKTGSMAISLRDQYDKMEEKDEKIAKMSHNVTSHFNEVFKKLDELARHGEELSQHDKDLMEENAKNAVTTKQVLKDITAKILRNEKAILENQAGGNRPIEDKIIEVEDDNTTEVLIMQMYNNITQEISDQKDDFIEINDLRKEELANIEKKIEDLTNAVANVNTTLSQESLEMRDESRQDLTTMIGEVMEKITALEHSKKGDEGRFGDSEARLAAITEKVNHFVKTFTQLRQLPIQVYNLQQKIMQMETSGNHL